MTCISRASYGVPFVNIRRKIIVLYIGSTGGHNYIICRLGQLINGMSIGLECRFQNQVATFGYYWTNICTYRKTHAVIVKITDKINEKNDKLMTYRQHIRPVKSVNFTCSNCLSAKLSYDGALLLYQSSQRILCFLFGIIVTEIVRVGG